MDAATFDGKLSQFLQDLDEQSRQRSCESIATLKTMDHRPRGEWPEIIKLSVRQGIEAETAVEASVTLKMLFGKEVA